MQRAQLTSLKSVSIVVILIVSNNIIMGLPQNVEQDTWAALLLSLILVLPLFAVYARLVQLMPGKDIFEMVEYLWGRTGGRIVCFLLAWYPLHLAALVIRSFSEFVHLTSLFFTPMLVVMLALFAAGFYIARSGVDTLGRWSGIMFVFAFVAMAGIMLFSAQAMDHNNLNPVLDHSFGEIFVASAKLVPFPFAEAVLLLGLAGNFKKGENPYKIYAWGAILGVVMLLGIFFRCICILGPQTLGAVYFPTYRAASIIRIGGFVERIEALVSFTYIFAGITKAAVCLIVSAKGYAKVFAAKDYKDMVVPVGFLALALCAISFQDIMEMFAFLEFYRWYALFFQVLIPLVIWICAEAKVAREKKRGALPTGTVSSGAGE